ncbi:MAG: hypothetical protein LBV03_05015 [Fusobacteriales bacterium]|nr:hypothetical protein [Fusobacteriales bacterium]
MNDLAKKQYGYAIENKSLPLSDNLINKLISMQEEYTTYIDWEYPKNPSPWTEKHKLDFFKRASAICMEIQEELGSKFKIINDVLKNII